jgi:hypothetical protein
MSLGDANSSPCGAQPRTAEAWLLLRQTVGHRTGDVAAAVRPDHDAARCSRRRAWSTRPGADRGGFERSRKNSTNTGIPSHSDPSSRGQRPSRRRYRPLYLAGSDRRSPPTSPHAVSRDVEWRTGSPGPTPELEWEPKNIEPRRSRSLCRWGRVGSDKAHTQGPRVPRRERNS